MPDRAGRDALSGVQSRLREAWPALELGWALADDLHLTLRYLGDLAPAQLESALATLALPEAEPALALRFAGIELWPTVRPRMAVARFDSTPRLGAWVDSLERWAVDNGLPAELRPHAAHVTLLRAPRPLAPLSTGLHPDLTIRFTSVQAMHRSEAARGPRYEGHAEYRLA